MAIVSIEGFEIVLTLRVLEVLVPREAPSPSLLVLLVLLVVVATVASLGIMGVLVALPLLSFPRLSFYILLGLPFLSRQHRLELLPYRGTLALEPDAISQHHQVPGLVV